MEKRRASLFHSTLETNTEVFSKVSCGFLAQQTNSFSTLLNKGGITCNRPITLLRTSAPTQTAGAQPLCLSLFPTGTSEARVGGKQLRSSQSSTHFFKDAPKHLQYCQSSSYATKAIANMLKHVYAMPNASSSRKASSVRKNKVQTFFPCKKTSGYSRATQKEHAFLILTQREQSRSLLALREPELYREGEIDSKAPCAHEKLNETHRC